MSVYNHKNHIETSNKLLHISNKLEQLDKNIEGDRNDEGYIVGINIIGETERINGATFVRISKLREHIANLYDGGLLLFSKEDAHYYLTYGEFTTEIPASLLDIKGPVTAASIIKINNSYLLTVKHQVLTFVVFSIAKSQPDDNDIDDAKDEVKDNDMNGKDTSNSRNVLGNGEANNAHEVKGNNDTVGIKDESNEVKGNDDRNNRNDVIHINNIYDTSIDCKLFTAVYDEITDVVMLCYKNASNYAKYVIYKFATQPTKLASGQIFKDAILQGSLQAIVIPMISVVLVACGNQKIICVLGGFSGDGTTAAESKEKKRKSLGDIVLGQELVLGTPLREVDANSVIDMVYSADNSTIIVAMNNLIDEPYLEILDICGTEIKIVNKFDFELGRIDALIYDQVTKRTIVAALSDLENNGDVFGHSINMIFINGDKIELGYNYVLECKNENTDEQFLDDKIRKQIHLYDGVNIVARNTHLLFNTMSNIDIQDFVGIVTHGRVVYRGQIYEFNPSDFNNFKLIPGMRYYIDCSKLDYSFPSNLTTESFCNIFFGMAVGYNRMLLRGF